MLLHWCIIYHSFICQMVFGDGKENKWPYKNHVWSSSSPRPGMSPILTQTYYYINIIIAHVNNINTCAVASFTWAEANSPVSDWAVDSFLWCGLLMSCLSPQSTGTTQSVQGPMGGQNPRLARGTSLHAKVSHSWSTLWSVHFILLSVLSFWHKNQDHPMNERSVIITYLRQRYN